VGVTVSVAGWRDKETCDGKNARRVGGANLLPNLALSRNQVNTKDGGLQVALLHDKSMGIILIPLHGLITWLQRRKNISR